MRSTRRSSPLTHKQRSACRLSAMETSQRPSDGVASRNPHLHDRSQPWKEWDQPCESKTRLIRNRTFGQNTVRIFHNGKYTKDQATPKPTISPKAYRNETPEEAVESAFPTEQSETAKTDLWLSSAKKGATTTRERKREKRETSRKNSRPHEVFYLGPSVGFATRTRT